MKMYSASLTLALFALSGLLWASDNSELKIGMSQEFENLNPVIAQMGATHYIYGLVGRTLNALDPDGNNITQLAVETPTLENGLAAFFEEDGKRKLRVHWEIKEEAVWGDGAPVTGHDFKLSWQIGLANTVSVGDREKFEAIERIEVDTQNPKKFALVYDAPKFGYFRMYRFSPLPSRLEGPIFERHKGENEGYEKNSLYNKDPANPGLYNGPFRVSEIKLGSHVIVVPNEKWWGKQPAIQKIILKFMPDTAALEANLLSGTLDMISRSGLKMDQALAFKKRVTENGLPFVVNYRPTMSFERIDLQIRKNEMLQDARVRKALVYAIDRDQLCDTLFEGKQVKALHSVAPLDPWYTDDPEKIALYRYSKRTANRLLDEAGWGLGDDGYRYKDGKRLSFQLMTTAQDKSRENVQVYLQSQWKEVGIEITIRNEVARVYFGETIRKGSYPAMAMFSWTSRPENSPRSFLHSASIPTEANGYSGLNSGGWVNPEVDKLIEALEQEFNFEKRRDIAHKILYHYTDEVPVIPLYYRSDVSVTPSNMEGYRLTGSLVSPTNWVEEWHLK